MLCEHARKATTVVPKRYRHLSKVPKRCPARTVGHPNVIKGARHVPGPIRELTSLILHDHGGSSHGQGDPAFAKKVQTGSQGHRHGLC